MKKVPGADYFNRPTVEVARSLLGKILVRKIGMRTYVLMITETEAYDGFADRASHAHRGKTKRNYPMFGEAGRWYVYFTYGMHWMLNIVTGKKDYPAAVLIRAAMDADSRGNARGQMRTVINGPAKLTKFLHIDKKLSDKKAERRTGLWIEDRGVYPDSHGRIRIGEDRSGAALFACIKKSSRIGIRYAGATWGNKKYRFFIAPTHT
ncbi:MAG: DNA-3-methyladenine glycosylase [bacterium]|nr:DNA-3-methyladenine glycosylase [bacterium]